MTDVADYELDQQPPTHRPPVTRPPSLTPWIALILAAAIAAAAAGYLYVRSTDTRNDTAASVSPAGAAGAPAAPLGVEVEPIELPPLDATDTLVRDLVRALSSHPRVMAWLATDGLIRNVVVVTNSVANGRSPGRQLGVLKPAQPFSVVDANGTPVLDVRSHERYNDIAAAAASLDAAGAARLFSLLKPRINDAYAELGQAGTFDQLLERAIVRLLDTPVVDGELALVARGALYQFNDARLEHLSAPQKHLVRMGPRNMRTIQRKLRDVALALGIPADRLP